MWHGDGAGASPSSSRFAAMLAAARGGDGQATGVLLQSFRPYLLAIARRGLPEGLRGKCDGADVVQETLLEAHRGLSNFHGAEPDDLRVWLCGILKHNLIDLVRRYRETSKRSIDRERSLESGPDSGGFSGQAVDPCLTPSSHIIARERLAALQDALARLPVDERAVIILRHFEALSFQEVGDRLDRSSEAARKLWSRAIARLKRMLDIAPGIG